MSVGFIAAVIALVTAQLALPKRLAFLPLVVAACHIGNVEILPELTTARLLILLGLVRAYAGGSFAWSHKSKLDVLLFCFPVLAALSSLGHQADEYTPSPLHARLGLGFNVFGTYLYARAFLPDMDAFRRYACALPFILLPLALGMAFEHATQRNPYFLLGSASEMANVREGKVRAQGPFRHPILAGTAGATALPFAYLLWRLGRKRLALLGLSSCMGVTLACASSGPLAAVAVTLASVILWPRRHLLKYLLWGAIFLGLLYYVVKGRGPWYLMASIDLVGGSTGWHRAYLIDQGLHYLDEWWLCGADYTRHWMASGVSWNPNMVDFTNYYLHLGVIGGLPLTLSLFGFIGIAFHWLNFRMRALRSQDEPSEIVLWCAAASLATHAISFVSISYFDQMYVVFYMLLGAIPGLVGGSSINTLPTVREKKQAEPAEAQPLRFYS